MSWEGRTTRCRALRAVLVGPLKVHGATEEDVRWLTKEGRMESCGVDLLARYERFSNESATIVNRALSAVRPDIDRALSDDARAREELFRLNDLQLFLLQVIAFDGFITRCIHAVGLGGAARRPLLKRIDLLASPEVKKRDKYKALRASIEAIARVRNAWAHRLCEEEISDDVDDLRERFRATGEGRLPVG